MTTFIKVLKDALFFKEQMYNKLRFICSDEFLINNKL